MPDGKSQWGQNQLLAALSPGVRERLSPHAEHLSLPLKQVLCEPGVVAPHVDFPTDVIISLVAVLAEGMTVEVAAVGREGMVGLPSFLGSGSMPTLAFVQIAGRAFRVASGPFRAEFERGEELSRLLLLDTETAFNQVARSVVCNRAHGICERCARWLLATRDGVGDDRFELTQEFLAQMLGARRAAVNAAASGLQRDGLITYTRGRLTVVDRAGLESAACEMLRRDSGRVSPTPRRFQATEGPAGRRGEARAMRLPEPE